MTTDNQQLISAYLDKEMNDIERASFEKRLQSDDELAQQLIEFKDNDEAIKQHYAAIDDKPVPDEIMALLKQSDSKPAIETAPKEAKNKEQDNIVQLKPRKQNQPFKPLKWGSIAASFFVAALCIPMFMNTSQDAYPDLASVLNSEPSGQSLALSKQQHVYLSMSFTDNSGRLCREYQLLDKNSAIQTIACYQEGLWQSQVSGNIHMPDHKNYQPASGEMASEVETWLDNNMASDPFGLDEEKSQLSTRRYELNKHD